ncbi:restriction endonuclease (plasmid) [Paraburkholderia strydomiana]
MDGNRYRIPLSSGKNSRSTTTPALKEIEVNEHNVAVASLSSDSAPTLVHVRTSLDAYVAISLLACLRNSENYLPASLKFLRNSYGFQDVRVTARSRDGGIDGYGELKMGPGTFTVAFQCKRYGRAKVQRPAIDAFRGEGPTGACNTGHFTTISFTTGALLDSRRSGAIPVVLIDGKEIVNLMINNQFGVQVETPAVPVNPIDLVLLDEERGT